MANEIATFGAVHLNVTNLERSIIFWKEYIGFKVRKLTSDYTEMGTSINTLIKLYPTADTSFRNGYSGLYHLAIHVSSEKEFARVLQRLISRRYPISTVDHTMSKAIYLQDPDDVTVEITLETPERFVRYEFGNGTLEVLDRQGNIKSGAAPLDVEPVLNILTDSVVLDCLGDETKVGHLHLFVADIQPSISFYQGLGFTPNPHLTGFPFADLSAGGIFTHRIGINNWQSANRQQAPEKSAGMRYFTIIFDTPDYLVKALQSVSSYQQHEDGYLVSDPSGNRILIHT